MPCEGKREVGEVVDVDLRFVGSYIYTLASNTLHSAFVKYKPDGQNIRKV